MKKTVHLLALLLAALCLSASSAWALPTVVIDAGHGGHDRGGVPGDRYPEKIYTLDVAKRLEARLRAAGYRTVMTRRGDYFVSLGARCGIANSQRNAIFVSIHFNSATREGANGIETYYYSRQSGRLASAIHSRALMRGTSSSRRRPARCSWDMRST